VRPEFAIRPATVEEADIIAGHRRAMFSDMGYRDEQALLAMAVAFRQWLLRTMAAGEYLAWFAVAADGSVAAGLGLWLMDWPPHMVEGGSQRGNILNVYTERAYRRRGLARCLMEMVLDWCRQQDVPIVILHASEEGRALYESLGFKATNEMRMDL
jgi:ribosomal protein S18 acetylase RimI-like enzyme